MAGVLILHGFTSHPILTVGPLPQVLVEAGFTVAQPALPGHGTRPEDLVGVRWQQWVEAALEAYQTLPQPAAVVGLSMGGLVAAHVASRFPVRALVALVPALGYQNRAAWLAPYLHPLLGTVRKGHSLRAPGLNPNYPYYPASALAQLIHLTRTVPPLLPTIKAPALVVQARHDSTIPEAAVRRYHQLLGSPDKSYKVFEDSEHDLLLDQEAHKVARTVADWLLAHFTP